MNRLTAQELTASLRIEDAIEIAHYEYDRRQKRATERRRLISEAAAKERMYREGIRAERRKVTGA